MATLEATQKLLEKYSVHRYYIEYYYLNFSNHISHGIVALHLLGAPEAAIKEHAEWYVKKRELKDPRQDEGPCPPIEELLGKRKFYYEILQHYEARLKDLGSIKSLLQAEYPKMASGLISALFHTVIQMGYGIAADYEPTILEGLAYLHYAYTVPKLADPKSLIEPLKGGNKDLYSLLEEVRLDDRLHTALKEVSQNADAPGDTPRFKQRHALLNQEADTLLRMANELSLPDSFTAPSPDLKAISNGLVKMATLVYVSNNETNDFFLLHGVTAAWSVKKILDQFNDAGDEVLGPLIPNLTRSFFYGLMFAYIVAGCPELTLLTPPEGDTETWDSIVARTISDTERDEHVYKCVQVCRDLAAECPQDEDLYKQGALRAVDHPLAFGSE